MFFRIDKKNCGRFFCFSWMRLCLADGISLFKFLIKKLKKFNVNLEKSLISAFASEKIEKRSLLNRNRPNNRELTDTFRWILFVNVRSIFPFRSHKINDRCEEETDSDSQTIDRSILRTFEPRFWKLEARFTESEKKKKFEKNHFSIEIFVCFWSITNFMMILARRKRRMRPNTKNGHKRMKAMARRRKPVKGNHREIDWKEKIESKTVWDFATIPTKRFTFECDDS